MPIIYNLTEPLEAFEVTARSEAAQNQIITAGFFRFHLRYQQSTPLVYPIALSHRLRGSLFSLSLQIASASARWLHTSVQVTGLQQWLIVMLNFHMHEITPDSAGNRSEAPKSAMSKWFDVWYTTIFDMTPLFLEADQNGYRITNIRLVSASLNGKKPVFKAYDS